MSRIDFKPIALPSFDSALELYKQSGTGLQNVFKDLASTFSGLETEVKAKNDAAIKDFINQAATTQALQSPEFQQQLQAKQQELGGVYTPETISAYRDSRVDTLNKRAADALQMQTSQYAYDRGLLTDQRTDSTLRAAQQLATGNGSYKDLVNDPNVDPVSLLGLQTNLNASSTLEGTKKAIALLASGASVQQALAASPNADPAAVMKMFQDSEVSRSNLATADVTRREATQRIAAGEFNLGIQKQLGSALNGNSGGVVETPVGNLPVSSTYSTNKAKWESQKVELSNRFNQLAAPMQAAAAKYQLPIELLMATGLVESSASHADKDGKLTSSGKAYGVMQLTPPTAQRFGVTNIADLNQNIEGAAKYLRFLMNRYNGDLPRVIAAYNAGEGNVDKYKGIPPFAETREYVPKVLDAIRWLSEVGGTARVVGGIDPNRIGAGSNGLTLEAAPKAAAGTLPDINSLFGLGSGEAATTSSSGVNLGGGRSAKTVMDLMTGYAKDVADIRQQAEAKQLAERLKTPTTTLDQANYDRTASHWWSFIDSNGSGDQIVAAIRNNPVLQKLSEEQQAQVYLDVQHKVNGSFGGFATSQKTVEAAVAEQAKVYTNKAAYSVQAQEVSALKSYIAQFRSLGVNADDFTIASRLGATLDVMQAAGITIPKAAKPDTPPDNSKPNTPKGASGSWDETPSSSKGASGSGGGGGKPGNGFTIPEATAVFTQIPANKLPNPKFSLVDASGVYRDPLKELELKKKQAEAAAKASKAKQEAEAKAKEAAAKLKRAAEQKAAQARRELERKAAEELARRTQPFLVSPTAYR